MERLIINLDNKISSTKNADLIYMFIQTFMFSTANLLVKFVNLDSFSIVFFRSLFSTIISIKGNHFYKSYEIL